MTGAWARCPLGIDHGVKVLHAGVGGVVEGSEGDADGRLGRQTLLLLPSSRLQVGVLGHSIDLNIPPLGI